MELETLPNWDGLTDEEQDRLREVYGEKPKITPIMKDTKITSRIKEKLLGGKNG